MRKEQEERIRSWFAEHRATFTLHGPRDEERYRLDSLIWAKPGTSNYAIRYVIQGPTLMVWGDLDSAVYRWSQAITFPFLAGCDLQYFAGKCEASPKGRTYEEFDPETALQDFNERLKERAAEDYPQPDPHAIENGRKAIRYGNDDWQEWMRSEAMLVFGRDWYEFVPSFGKDIAQMCHAHLLGIKMACLESRPKTTNPADVLVGAKAP